MSDQNLIPEINAGGSFEALAPFDTVVDPDKFYTVEAIRTIGEMEGLKLNLYELIFEPIGVLEEDFSTVLERARAAGSVVITLLDKTGKPVNLLTTYLKSFPLTDGYVYERMCLVVDLGPCPPEMKNTIAQAQQHIKEYITSTIGITKDVKIGTVPTRGYTSAAQHDAYEAARALLITDSDNDVSRIKALENELVRKDNYIAMLEAQLTIP